MSIISLHPVRERDHVSVTSVAFAVSTVAPVAAAPCAGCQCAPMTCDGGCGHNCCCPDSYPLPAAAAADERLVVIDAEQFAERIRYALGERFGAALLQRTEIRVGLDDELLVELAARADYSRTAVRP